MVLSYLSSCRLTCIRNLSKKYTIGLSIYFDKEYSFSGYSKRHSRFHYSTTKISDFEMVMSTWLKLPLKRAQKMLLIGVLDSNGNWNGCKIQPRISHQEYCFKRNKDSYICDMEAIIENLKVKIVSHITW